MSAVRHPPARGAVSRWLGTGRLGLAVMALAVGAGAGLGAAVFRWFIYTFTWLPTDYDQFGQLGQVLSRHMEWLASGFSSSSRCSAASSTGR